MSEKEVKVVKPAEQFIEERNFIQKGYDFIIQLINSMLFDTSIVAPMFVLMFFLEAMLLELIIIKVPYTEIDYSTYMQQITQIERGELNYDNIKGDTGPIVYPGGYVFIYSWMKLLTDGMNNLVSGQEAFRLLYLMTFVLTFLIYIMIEGKHKVKPYVFYLLVISKRLHSIYVLRLFNDCFTTFFMLGTILLLQLASKYKQSSYDDKYDKNEKWEFNLHSKLLALLAIDCYCFGLSVKMNALLYLPGLFIILYFLNDENLIKFLSMIAFGILVMLGINYQFLLNGKEIRDSFLRNAFDFNREFMYKWSINWKFLSEDVFHNPIFQKTLLILHVFTLIIFTLNKWVSPKMTGKSVIDLIIKDGILKFYKNTINRNNFIIGPDGCYYVAIIMMMSNLIGVLFSRSLHYQFLSWYMHSLPFLLSQCGGASDSYLKVGTVAVLVFIHEFAWNVYPSAWYSSAIIVSIISITVLGCLFTRETVTKVKQV